MKTPTALLITFLSALLFGVGLIVSGMSNPAKVLAFLDLGDNWDPSLALVMAGAILVAGPAFAWARMRGTTLDGSPLKLPDTNLIDRRLVIGSLVFGLGWGLAGICPGPALVLLGSLNAKALVFVLAMLAGMYAFELLERRRAARAC